MSNEESNSSALSALRESSATGGGAKTSMPISEWISAIMAGDVVQIATFHGVKGEQVGYRSGEIHNQLRQNYSKYFYVYRNVEDSDQPQLFVARTQKVFLDAGIAKAQVQSWVEP